MNPTSGAPAQTRSCETSTNTPNQGVLCVAQPQAYYEQEPALRITSSSNGYVDGNNIRGCFSKQTEDFNQPGSNLTPVVSSASTLNQATIDAIQLISPFDLKQTLATIMSNDPIQILRLQTVLVFLIQHTMSQINGNSLSMV